MTSALQDLAGVTDSSGNLLVISEAAISGEDPGDNINQDANVAVNSNGAIMIKFYA